MKTPFDLAIVLLLLVIFGCSKEVKDPDNSHNVDFHTSNPFGVIVNDLGSGSNIQNLKVAIAKSLHTRYVSNAIIMQNRVVQTVIQMLL
jgi:hypothetical protein